MEKCQLKINLLGTSFSIQSGERKEYLEAILSYYKSKIDELTNKAVVSDPLKQAIIAGLNIVDELFKERNRNFPSDQYSGMDAGELNKITERMINKISDTLKEGDLSGC